MRFITAVTIGMTKTLWTSCKQLFRMAWKVFKLLFLLTLPLTLLPIITGLLNGAYFAFYRDSTIATNSDAWVRELNDLNNDWGVPGHTFRSFQDMNNNFRIMRLNFDDWWSKLGFVLPQEYALHIDTLPINKYADLETLMANTDPKCGTPPLKEQWVYISERSWGMSEWDEAFDAAVQAAYVPGSALNDTRFFHVHCGYKSEFLCGVWGVRAPTLLHFLVEDAAPESGDIEPGLSYTTSLANLRPVTVRVIEFPLKDAYTGLPSSIFPGPKEQVLAIMTGDKMFEQFDPWNEFTQSTLRFYEILDPKYEDKSSLFYYLGETDQWITKNLAKPLHIDDALQVIHGVALLSSMLVVNLAVLLPWHCVAGLVGEFLGRPKRGDWIMAEGEGMEWNPWDALMGVPDALGGMGDAIREGLEKKRFADEGVTMDWGAQEPFGAKATGTAAY